MIEEEGNSVLQVGQQPTDKTEPKFGGTKILESSSHNREKPTAANKTPTTTATYRHEDSNLGMTLGRSYNSCWDLPTATTRMPKIGELKILE